MPGSLIVCTAPSLQGEAEGGGGVEPLTKFSKRGGLAGPQLLEGGCWERGGYFFQGGGLQLSYKKLILCLIMNFMFN